MQPVASLGRAATQLPGQVRVIHPLRRYSKAAIASKASATSASSVVASHMRWKAASKA